MLSGNQIYDLGIAFIQPVEMSVIKNWVQKLLSNVLSALSRVILSTHLSCLVKDV